MALPVEEKRALWQATQKTAEWTKYRQGGRQLNGVKPDDVRALYAKLGLPWEESDDSTISRNSFVLWMLGKHGGRISKFLNEMNVLSSEDGEQTDLDRPVNVAPPDPANAVLVIDLGSNNTTVGWAGELRPVKTFSTIVGDKRPIFQVRRSLCLLDHARLTNALDRVDLNDINFFSLGFY